jgi:glutamine synthetase
MNYFGPVCPRVKALLEEVSAESFKVGMSMKVYHNEVAPGQHEYSPIFSLTNIANDQNQLAMQISNDVAAKHGLTILWHEKPFAGINGSGKHSNWGLNTDSGKNLYAPGKTAESQADFAAFVAALLFAVHKHGDVLRGAIATAGNDHRLGAQEAPPAIISLYTGIGLEKHLKAIIDGGELSGYMDSGKMVETGSSNVEPIKGASEDRNRTAPLPFCGNRFEFRAVGSSQNIAFPLAMLNTAVADGCAAISDLIESGKSPSEAVGQILNDSWPALFNGDGYSDEWPIEAASRGLKNLRTSPDAFAEFDSEKNQELFEKYGVFTKAETIGRAETLYEQYVAQVSMEAATMMEMMDTGIIPACAEDLKYYSDTTMGGDRAALYGDMSKAAEKLRNKIDGVPEDVHAAAAFMLSDVIPAMEATRTLADTAEKRCRRDLWPYPTYGEVIYTHHSEA